jgi:hypothetical protein
MGDRGLNRGVIAVRDGDRATEAGRVPGSHVVGIARLLVRRHTAIGMLGRLQGSDSPPKAVAREATLDDCLQFAFQRVSHSHCNWPSFLREKG